MAGFEVSTEVMLDRSLMIAPPPVVAEALARTREALAALVRRCGELGADLVVLVIPAAIQAEPARFQDFLAQHREATRGSYSRTQLHRHLVDMVRTLGIRVADPLPRLEAEAEAGRPCYHREGHWNAAGHALAADLLQPVLAELFVAREKRGPRQASGAHP